MSYFRGARKHRYRPTSTPEAHVCCSCCAPIPPGEPHDVNFYDRDSKDQPRRRHAAGMCEGMAGRIAADAGTGT